MFEQCCVPIGFIGFVMFLSSFRVVMEFQRGVVFRFGRLSGMKMPGFKFLIPFIDRMTIVDLRIQMLDIPKQEMLTKDNISTFINAVVYYRIVDPEAAILKVQDYRLAIFQHGQAAMRDIAGSVELDTLLYDRERVAKDIKGAVSKETVEWGVDIVSINIQDIELPVDMKKAMARQAQAERDKRATVIVSIGEVEAAETMAQAAKMIATQPGALHLRTLQALSNLSADKTNTITYLLPLAGQSVDYSGGESLPADPVVFSSKKKG